MNKTVLLSAIVGALALWGACGEGYGLQDTEAVCGNGVVETGEACDASELGGADCASLNLGTGALECAADCTFDVSGCSETAECGNGTAEYPEPCDGADLAGTTCEDLGYGGGGALACTSGCELDTSGCEAGGECGNGAVEPGEQCDGQDLDGASCTSLGLGAGELSCGSGCAYDISGCSTPPECGNGAIEFSEVCDGQALDGQTCESQGYYGGTLGCATDCSAFDVDGCVGTCGDAAINGPEVCDGTALDGETCRSRGYYGGALGCAGDCSAYDESGCGGSCGDGTLNGPEVCDTSDFGQDSCQQRGFYTGSLTCSADCQQIDESGCSEYCGDGVINGPEVCDTDQVGGDTCANHGLEGDLRCLLDCTGVDLASCIATDLLINEVGLGYPDFIELVNVGSSPIDLDGWVVEWNAIDDGAAQNGQLVLPPYTLAPGDRVELQDDYNDQSGDPPDVDPTTGVIVFHQNIPWTDRPGAVTLWDPNTDPVDFVRWSGTDFSPPAGTSWSDTPDLLPGSDAGGVSLSRVPELTDTDTAGDWCRAAQTPGAANSGTCLTNDYPPGSVLISEIQDDGQLDRVELYNPTTSSVDLTGWILFVIYTNQSWSWEELPAFILAGGAYVEIVDDASGGAYVDSNDVIHLPNLNIAESSGSVRLLEPTFEEGVDFVRWGGNAYGPTPPDTWADQPAPLPAISQGDSLGRSSLTDTDTAADWCLMSPSLGSANNACN